MNEKIIGYVLLALGVIVIVFAGVNVYLVFTKQIEPVQLFSGPGVSLDPATLLGNNLPAGVTIRPGVKQEIISGELINQTSNIFAHILLMGFLASVGFKLATLGVHLVRPIVVKVEEKSAGTYQIKHDVKV